MEPWGQAEPGRDRVGPVPLLPAPFTLHMKAVGGAFFVSSHMGALLRVPCESRPSAGSRCWKGRGRQSPRPDLAQGEPLGAGYCCPCSRATGCPPTPSSLPVLSVCRQGVCSISFASCRGSPAACMTCASCVGLACGTVVTCPPWSAQASTRGLRAAHTGALWRRLRPSPPEKAGRAQRRPGKASVSADRLGSPC